MKKLAFILFLFCLNVNSQDIKRKATHGAGLQIVNQQMASNAGIEKPQGLYVQFVSPNSTLANINIIAGDIILSINNIVTNSFEAIRNNPIYEGDYLEYEVFKDKKIQKFKTKAIGVPFETSEEIKIEYSAFQFQDGYIRSIISKPIENNKKLPAVLFIPGYPCQSVDNLWLHHPYKKLIYDLTKKGYIVMRAEKPGMGDSNNSKKCYSIDFDTEVESFKAALADLKKRDDVDPENVFIIGHSMGGMQAPYVALNNNVKGIISMGVTIKPPLEYLTEMLRNQNPKLGIDYLQNEKDMRLYEVLLYELFVNSKKPSELILENPDYDRILRRDFNYQKDDDFLSRDAIFWQSIHKKNLIESWAKTTTNVLSAWGESDIQSINDFSHKELVNIVNTYNPNKATFLELKGTNHNFIKIESLEESYRLAKAGAIGPLLPTHFNYEAVELFHQWMQEKIANN